MPSALPINIRDLLYYRGIESARVEFKAGWDATTPTGTAAQVLRTICAFANDLHNLNGGYIVLGIAEADGRAIVPPRGLSPAEIESIQRWIRGKCKERIDPEYQPVLSPEIVDDRHVLAVWCPGSETRPHAATESLKEGAQRRHYVRLGADTVVASGEVLAELLTLTARVPFDDRRAHAAVVEDLQRSLVREFLHDVRSGLLEETNDLEMYRKLRIVKRANGHEVPVNIGLMFFADDPERWFRGARIEVAQFADDSSGDVIEERTFRGPLHHQLRSCVSYLRNLSTTFVEKQPDRPEAANWVSYPLPALEEALANAIYHRGYDGEPEPTKVYLFPDRIEIISYPGPPTSLRREHFAAGARVPPVAARNRRIGELLRELGLAEARGTGVPKIFRAMGDNGSPPPRVDFDDARTYFQLTLPAHPEWSAVSALRDAAGLHALGKRDEALQRLERAFAARPNTGRLATELIRQHADRHDIRSMERVFDTFLGSDGRADEVTVRLTCARELAHLDDAEGAELVLRGLPAKLVAADAVEAGRLAQQVASPQLAHDWFERAGSAVFDHELAPLDFARAKYELARQEKKQGSSTGAGSEKRLQEAREILEGLIRTGSPDGLFRAWVWNLLAKVLQEQGAPRSVVRQALVESRSSAPSDGKFVFELEQFDRESA